MVAKCGMDWRVEATACERRWSAQRGDVVALHSALRPPMRPIPPSVDAKALCGREVAGTLAGGEAADAGRRWEAAVGGGDSTSRPPGVVAIERGLEAL